MSRRFFIPALILVAVSLAPLADALWAQAVAQETQQAQQAAPGFWSLVFSKGGVVTWVIALLSAVGVPIAAIKLYEFYRMDIFRPQGFEAALSDMRRGSTRWRIRRHRSSLLRLVKAMAINYPPQCCAKN
ncbi:hypothetical protein N9W39_00180 [Alphaproteobacteria bacterium]|nr:hypothetical protein [Alphaproteobacteria bacterium]